MEFNLKVSEGEAQLIAAGLAALANGLVAKLQMQINEQLAQPKPPDLTLVQNEEQKEKIS